jgi:hypothetical protein
MKVLSRLGPYDLRLIALSSLVLGYIGIFLLVLSQIRLLKNRNTFLVTLGLAIIGSSYKQMQNFFMPICNGWMLAIFFIGIYYYSKQFPNSIKRAVILCICIFLAPLSIGLGMILPLVELIESFYKFLTTHKVTKAYLSPMNWLPATTSIFSIVFYSIYSKGSKGDVSGIETNLDISVLQNILSHPHFFIAFLLSLIGSIFVPSSRFDPGLSIFAGFLFISITTFLLLSSKKSLGVKNILLNKNPLLGGLLFVTLISVFRFSGRQEDISNAAAPRYVTGTLILIIGLVAMLVNQDLMSKKTNCLIILVSLSILVSGIKTGLEWHSTRFNQTQLLMKCSTEDFATTTSKCFLLAETNSMTPNQQFFKNQLQKFLRESGFGK